MTRYSTLGRRQIYLEKVGRRGNDLTSAHCSNVDSSRGHWSVPQFDELITAILTASRANNPVIIMLGGHPIKLGLSRYIIDLIERRVAQRHYNDRIECTSGVAHTPLRVGAFGTRSM